MTINQNREKVDYDALNKTAEKTLIQRPSTIVIVFAACFSFWLFDLWRPMNVYNGDSALRVPEVFQRYSYLPAVFFNHGSFDWHNELSSNTHVGPLGNKVPKYNYGTAAMDLPFFIAAWIHSDSIQIPMQSGFSNIFASYLHWGSILYVLLGLVALRKFLLAYFNEPVTALVLFLCLFGNLLFYYTYSFSELPQSHLFFLFSVFLLYTHQWHQHPGYANAITCGLLLGLISLIDGFETYIGLFFIFWNVGNRAGVKSKIAFFKNNRRFVILLLGTVLILWIPQLLINIKLTGWLFYNGYPNERYNFTEFKEWFMLTSFKHGWLMYTPATLLIFAGIFFIRPAFPVFKPVFVFAILLMIVFYSSWWDFEQGGFFGARAFCQSIAWLSVPLAFTVERVFYPAKKKPLQMALCCFIILFMLSCVCINIGQTYQVATHRLEPGKMTNETYFKFLRTYKFPDN